jgi:hypothetical protein
MSMKKEAPEQEALAIAKERPGDHDRSIQRIVVRPDEVIQPDNRPWRQTTFIQWVAGFLAISALVVFLGLAALVIGLRRAL